MAKNTNTYTLIYWKDSNWIVGTLRGIPGVISQGKTLDDLVANILDAYKELKKSAMKNFIPVKNSKRRKLEIAV